MPLTLIINQDAELLKRMREEMMGRKLDETTVKERQARYTAHIAFQSLPNVFECGAFEKVRARGGHPSYSQRNRTARRNQSSERDPVTTYGSLTPRPNPAIFEKQHTFS